MRGFIGLCLLVTGLSIGAYSHYPGSAHREASLVELTHIVTGSIHAESISKAHADELFTSNRKAHLNEPATSRLPSVDPILTTASIEKRGWFTSPKLLSTLDTKTAKAAQAQKVVRTKHTQKSAKKDRGRNVSATRARHKRAHRSAQRNSQIIGRWRTAVVPVHRAPQVIDKPAASLTPKTPKERWQLAMAIQRELKRVGCYWGKIDGVWGKGSKRAMAHFMQAVNAALPSRNPDYIQLQLVSSHKSTICGRTPGGSQIATRHRPTIGAGRMIVASRSTGAHPGPAIIKPRKAPLPGRMAIGALNRNQPPVLIAAPKRISRAIIETQQNESRQSSGKRLKITALPDPGYEVERKPNRVGADPQTDNSVARRDAALSDTSGPAITEPRAAPRKLRRTKASRKAAYVKKKRRRYSRYYRRRSLQNFFMHPLGRR